MTRGRKIDHTIPPTRSVTQQRDYRARKAQFVAGLQQRVQDLEEQCRRSEAENAQLRRELEVAKASSSQAPPVASYNPQTVRFHPCLLCYFLTSYNGY